MNRTLIVLAASAAAALPLLFVATATERTSPPPETVAPPSHALSADTPPVERAQAAAKAFASTLKSALSSRMAEAGPPGAVEFCSAEAPKIAARIGAEYGVRIGRVPVPGRQRNPENAATEWQAPILAGFQRNVSAGARPGDQMDVRTIDLPADVSLRMMRGIAVEPQCLACHGKAPAADTLAAIARHYPADTATGFDAGDLRGALWVEVPATGPGKTP